MKYRNQVNVLNGFMWLREGLIEKSRQEWICEKSVLPMSFWNHFTSRAYLLVILSKFSLLKVMFLMIHFYYVITHMTLPQLSKAWLSFSKEVRIQSVVTTCPSSKSKYQHTAGVAGVLSIIHFNILVSPIQYPCAWFWKDPSWPSSTIPGKASWTALIQ